MQFGATFATFATFLTFAIFATFATLCNFIQLFGVNLWQFGATFAVSCNFMQFHAISGNFEELAKKLGGVLRKKHEKSEKS